MMHASNGSAVAEQAHPGAAMSLSNDAVIVTDASHRVTAMNQAAEALTGWRAGTAAGMPVGMVLWADGTAPPPLDGRCMVQSRDGSLHAMVACSTPIRDPAGHQLGAVTVLKASDVRAHPATPQAQLDLAAPEVELAIDALGAGIRARAEEVAALMNVIPVAIYLAHDPDCSAVTSNRAADLLLATHGGGQATGPYAHRVFHDGRELGPHEMPIQRAAAEGIATDGEEYEIRFEDGSSKYIYGYATPLFGPDARTRGCVAAFVDVTERRRDEMALRESEQRFRVLADNVPVMIWVADRAGTLTYFNKTWRDYTGRGTRDGVPEEWLDCVHPMDAARVKADFRAHVEQRKPFAIELRLRRADGGYRWMMNTATPLYREDGEFAGYIGTCSDITESKLHEQQLEQADRQKDEFIATLAHELRNPLAPIRNALHILATGAVDGDRTRWAREVIERQVTQLVRLVDDLLDVARAACGHLELRRETITIDRVVHDAVEASRPMIEDGQHELHISLPADPVLVHGDPTRLAEIVINVLNNAAKYTPHGGRIWVVCERGDSHALVSIRDSGIGIAPEALPGIFRLFSQVDSSVDRSQGGLGVGLALARRLAELHGGELTAHSAGLGNGSEFVLKLPIAQGRSLEAPSTPYVARASRPTALRVLVVDDSADAVETLAILLRLSAHTVEIAHDGVTALERFRDFAPDVVILDIGLPGMSGYEAAQRIRELPRGADVTLIALTGWGREEERARAFAAGFDHHLTKPIALEQLQQLLVAQPQH